MEEYEYSFKVLDIKPFIKYCKDNGYKEVSVCEQNRIIYENINNKHNLARLTTYKDEKGVKTYFDFKNVGMEDKGLKISNESLPLLVTNENKKVVLSFIETLDYVEVANNFRTRYVFTKNNVTFEIDDYIKPKMQVVAIEGNKAKVDKVHGELIKKFGSMIE